MANSDPVYRKIRGMRAAGAGQMRRLWLAEDHLLAVSAAYGFERYRRFHFSEIRALVIRLNGRRLGLNIVFAVLAVPLLGGAALAFSSSSGGGTDATAMLVFFWILTVLGSLAVLGLVLNSAFGPSCEVFVQTLAGVESVGVPSRLRAARRLQALIGPLIEAAQGRPA